MLEQAGATQKKPAEPLLDGGVIQVYYTNRGLHSARGFALVAGATVVWPLESTGVRRFTEDGEADERDGAQRTAVL